MERKNDKPHILKSPLIAILWVGFIMAIYSNAVLHPAINIPFLQHAKLQFQDSCFKTRLFYNEHFRKDYPKESAVVLIAIDSESIKKTKQNPLFSKELIAEVIRKISECSPKVIVLDMMFFNNDNKSDLLIAEAIKNAGNVLVAYDSSKLGLDFVDSSILKASLGYGGADFAVLSDDGALRDFIPNMLQQGGIWTMPLVTITTLAYKDVPLNQVRRLDQGENKIIHGIDNQPMITLPLNENRKALINYLYDENNMLTVSLWKVIAGEFDPELFKGKIAILAVTAEIYNDIHYTPIGRIPGGMILANVINSFIYSDFLTEVPFIVQLCILYLVSVLLAILFYKTTLLKGLAILIFTICASLTISFTLFLHNIFWSAFDVIVLAQLLYVAILFHKASIWELESETIKQESD